MMQGSDFRNCGTGVHVNDIKITQAVGLFGFHATVNAIAGNQGNRNNKMIF